MLCDSEVLAAGSMRGFLSGKHFNRCKRLHPLLSTALQILHFRRFTELHGTVSDEELLHELASNPSAEASKVEESDVFIKLLDRYEQFCESTSEGDHASNH